MYVRSAEKRLSNRVSAAYPVRIFNDHGAVLTSGRTANTSENGLLAVVRRVPLQEEIQIEITLPSISGSARTRSQTRTVLYHAKVVRQQILGNLMGIGVQLLEKVE